MMIQQQTSASRTNWKQSTVNVYIQLNYSTEEYEYTRFYFKCSILRIDVTNIKENNLLFSV